RFKPVHVLVGPERFLIERATELLRRASLGDGPPGFNDDLFHGNQGLSAQRVIAAARTLPMMAQARFILVRDVDEAAAAEQDALAAYLDNASPSTCVVLTATKLDKRSKLAKAAIAAGAWADANPMKGAGLRRFTTDEAKRRGHALSSRAAEALVEAIGEDLAGLDDALERLSLYVGKDARIDVDAVEACVTRIAADSIWALVDAVGVRDTARALGAAGSLLDDREPPLKILAMVARQLRIVARMREALASGLRGSDAALAAGAPPFKADDLTEAARRFTAQGLGTAFTTLAEADLALKGSKVPPERILEEAIVQLCLGDSHARERIARKVRTYR
ncbi:MAG: DNA polymerase III subunit delta, partial [Sandaracinaceae bacterium]|nr:DNA polymerase III subunit delta [Sandaracinaceae bacterium]